MVAVYPLRPAKFRFHPCRRCGTPFGRRADLAAHRRYCSPTRDLILALASRITKPR